VRIGIYGGSFDPIHLGHLLVAETVREQLALDSIRWIPAYQSPLKQATPPTSATARLEMLRLAVADHPHFTVDDRELRRAGISYTVDTLRELHAEQPEVEWFLILGADSLTDLGKWKEPTTICQLALPIIVARGGHPLPSLDDLAPFMPPSRLALVATHTVTMPQIEISSRELRGRAAAGKSLRYRLPASVETYIRTRQIYRAPPPA
jgi:nicotinate-nucleotide adenylyltransferase